MKKSIIAINMAAIFLMIVIAPAIISNEVKDEKSIEIIQPCDITYLKFGFIEKDMREEEYMEGRFCTYITVKFFLISKPTDGFDGFHFYKKGQELGIDGTMEKVLEHTRELKFFDGYYINMVS